MDYKDLISGMRVISKYEKRREYNGINVGNVLEQSATAITDLLARAEAAEARAEKTERERDAAVQCLFEKCRHIESTKRGNYCVIDDEPFDLCVGVWRGHKEE